MCVLGFPHYIVNLLVKFGYLLGKFGHIWEKLFEEKSFGIRMVKYFYGVVWYEVWY